MGPVLAAAMPSLIGAAGSVIGGLIGSKGSDNKDARKMLRYEQAINRENLENSYPIMMKSMREGGLNPMLAMGARPEIPSVSGKQPINNKAQLGQAVSNAAVIGAQVANVAANTAKSEAEADLTKAQTVETIERTKNYEPTRNLTNAQITEVAPRIQKVLSDSALSSIQYNKVNSEIQQLVKQGNLTEAQISESLARADLTKAQITEIQPRISKLLAEAANIEASTGKSEILGLPGNMLRELLSNSAKSSNESAGAKIVKGVKNSARDFDFKSLNSPNYNRR